MEVELSTITLKNSSPYHVSMSKPPVKPHRVLPVAAGFQRGFDPARAVRGVPGRGGDEAAEQLLAARRPTRC